MSTTNSKLTVVHISKFVSYVGFAFVLVAEVILVLGFTLKLLGANPTVEFTQWAYRALDRVMAPFRGIFEDVTFDSSHSVLDVSILFAMLIYGLVAIGLRALLDWLARREDRLEHEEFLENAAAEQDRFVGYDGLPITEVDEQPPPRS